ncbi:HAD-IA family hydrolase [Ligilactobacillus acidipiscis]|uniref:HAD family hydrolase n=1 Tax=Ligilactobacillus acidipiscis TaxID=89059 RepID=UPI002FD8EB07
MKKKLILFDVDGTLVDSYPYYEKIMLAALPKFGVNPSQAQLSRAFTMTAKQEVEYFKIPVGRLDEWFAEYDAIAQKVELQPEAYPGVDRMFDHLLAAPDVKLGIVTSRTTADAQENLQSFWWFKKMSLIVTSSDTKHPKPSAEPLQFALNTLGYQAEDAFYIGDADTDESSAIKAKVAFGGALWGTGTRDNFKSETLLLDSPEDVIMIV